MDDDDRKKQAAVLAAIAKLPKDISIEEWNRQLQHCHSRKTKVALNFDPIRSPLVRLNALA
jgi:hypothetical protein